MSKKRQIVTSLRVDPELWKEAKIEAIRRGITLAEIVDQALRKELKLEKLKEKVEQEVVER